LVGSHEQWGELALFVRNLDQAPYLKARRTDMGWLLGRVESTAPTIATVGPEGIRNTSVILKRDCVDRADGTGVVGSINGPNIDHVLDTLEPSAPTLGP
jgi:hypothetical protein